MIGKMILCLAALSAFGVAALRAGEPSKARPQKTGKAEYGTFDKPAIRPAGAKQIESLTAEFSVTREEVTRLRDTGLGWGEVRHVLSLSQKTGKPASEIMQMRKDGMGWGEIAKQEGVKLGPAEKGGAPKPDRSDKGMMGRDRGNRRSK